MIRTHIDHAVECNSKGTYSFPVFLDEVEDIVKAFKNLCPNIKHQVSIDWDDDTLYKIRFTWEPGTFGIPMKPTPPIEPLPIKTPVPTQRPQAARYGGPRW